MVTFRLKPQLEPTLMEQILNRPEIQSAVAPFIVALLFSLGLKKVTASAWIWSIFAAFLIAASLINGLTLTPLTGTRKIILAVLGALVVSALAPGVIQRANLRRSLLVLLPMLAVLWVFWKVAMRMEITGIALFVTAAVGLVVALTWAFDRLTGDPASFHAAGFSLMLGTGLCATAAASALLGQLALSLSAASGAVLLAWVLFGNAVKSPHLSKSLTALPYILAPALFGIAAVLLARLPWYALIPLATIPAATSLVPGKIESRFFSALVQSIPGLVIALVVSFWVWQTGSSDSGY
ncbi:MAG: hypothetical protein GY935_24510 [Gammaproteobacteria bacterium]|nr:hypothetical protein [Gammaproteobacteria bacterium]